MSIYCGDVFICCGYSKISHDETKNQGKNMKCQGDRIIFNIHVIIYLHQV